MEEKFEYAKKTFRDNIFSISNFEENIHLITYSLLAFLVPFMIGHPQFIVGVIVNAALILGATYLKGYKLLPVIMIPSIAVLSRGMIFGPYTIFLIYMIPFIWVGNAILTYVYRALQHKKINYAFSFGAGVIIKTAFLFGCAYALVSLGVLPALFLTTMGLFQLYTALLGGAVAWGAIKGVEASKKRNDEELT